MWNLVENTSVLISVELSNADTSFKLVRGDLKFSVPVRIAHFHNYAMKLVDDMMNQLSINDDKTVGLTSLTVTLDIQHPVSPFMFSLTQSEFLEPDPVYDFVHQAKESMGELLEKLTEWALESDAESPAIRRAGWDADPVAKKKRHRAGYMLKKHGVVSACVLLGTEVTAHDINHTGKTKRFSYKGALLSEYDTPKDWLGRSPPRTKSYHLLTEGD